MEKLKIFTVDDNESFRKGIIFYLEQVLKHAVIGYSADGEQFMRQRDKSSTADIILTDIQMPKIKGILAAKHILGFHYTKIVIAITDFQNTVGLMKLISEGFKSCVFKNRIFEDLPVAIENVMRGEFYYPDNVKLEDGDFTRNTLE